MDPAELPSWDEVLITALSSAGLSTLVLSPLVVGLWLLDWYRNARDLARAANHLGNLKWPPLVPYLAIQGIVAGLVFAGTRLVMSVRAYDQSNPPISAEAPFRWDDTKRLVASFTDTDEVTTQATLVTLALLTAYTLCCALGLATGRRILEIAGFGASILAIIGAVGMGVIGLMVLSLATWMGDPTYSVAMASVYLAGCVILAAAPFCASAIATLSREAFGPAVL